MKDESCIWWTETALDDFEDFKDLLNDCAGIDSANGIVERLQRLIKLSEKIKRSRWADRKNPTSLYNQLQIGFDLAIKRKHEAKATPTA